MAKGQKMRPGPKKNRNDWTREKKRIAPRKETRDTTNPSFQAHLAGLDEDELAGFRAANIGFLFQSYNLVSTLTAWENGADDGTGRLERR